MKQKLCIYTIGHSTRPIDTFLEIIKHYHVTQIVDIRTVPKSRHNPQYNGPKLAYFLRNRRINYRHQKDLGGLRHAHKDSVNLAWENTSFRGFADYMQTAEFEKGLETLISIAHRDVTAIMCVEAVPWRCHRSLIADALLIRDIDVLDIYSLTSVKAHTLTPWALVHGTTITYPKAT